MKVIFKSFTRHFETVTMEMPEIDIFTSSRYDGRGIDCISYFMGELLIYVSMNYYPDEDLDNIVWIRRFKELSEVGAKKIIRREVAPDGATTSTPV